MSDTIRFFQARPVFSRSEFAAAAAERGSTPQAIDAALGYHVRAGRLIRLRRGLYATVPPGMPPADVVPDPILVASRAAPDAILAYDTALELHGLGHAPLRRVTAMSAHGVRTFSVHGVAVQFVRPSLAVRRAHAVRFGLTSTIRSGVEIEMTGLERTVVDVLDRPDLAGGTEGVWRSITAIAWLSVKGAVAYAEMLGNRTTAAKLGVFLQRNRERLRVSDEHLSDLRRMRPTQPHYASTSARDGMRLVAEWNLLVPPLWIDEEAQG